MTSPAVARKTASAYQWDLVLPAASAGADRSVLEEISEFRGRVLYAGGRRPGFRRENGEYADDDPLDSESYHVTVRDGDDLVGYLRIRGLPEYCQSYLERVLSRRQFEAALKEMRLMPEDCLEVSRWIVAPAARGTAVASTLVVSAYAIGTWLGKRRLLATVGLRDGQAAMLARFGGQVLSGAGAKFVAEYDDELAVMQFDLDAPSPRVAAELRSVGRMMRLEERRAPRVGAGYGATEALLGESSLSSHHSQPAIVREAGHGDVDRGNEWRWRSSLPVRLRRTR